MLIELGFAFFLHALVVGVRRHGVGVYSNEPDLEKNESNRTLDQNHNGKMSRNHQSQNATEGADPLQYCGRIK